MKVGEVWINKNEGFLVEILSITKADKSVVGGSLKTSKGRMLFITDTGTPDSLISFAYIIDPKIKEEINTDVMARQRFVELFISTHAMRAK